MIVDGPSYPIAVALTQYLHEIEPSRAYDSIIFTDLGYTGGPPPPEIDVRDIRPLMSRLDERLGHCSFIRASVTITKECYARLVLDEFLGEKYKRCLYVDYDVFFKRALSPLFSVDIANADFAAVSSLTHLISKMSVRHNIVMEKLARVGLEPGSDLFNSGVMLINLNRFRFEEFASAAEKFKHDGRLGDQNLLNRVYHGKWAKLSPKWNLLTPFLLPKIEKAIQPRIIHFAGPDKPWHRTWIGDQTYRRDILNVFRRYGVSPPQHRKRKPSLSDKIKKHMASIEPTRSIYTMHDKLKRWRAAQDFLDSVRLAEQNGEFADAQIITTA
jgi:lipopolysaccharide biosynthesis glycosyltransferase